MAVVTSGIEPTTKQKYRPTLLLDKFKIGEMKVAIVVMLVMTVLGNLTPSNFNNLFGSWNRVSGSHNTNFGNCNKIQGHGNLNIGADLQVQGSGNRVVGANHCVQGNGVVMFGTNADPKFYNYDLGGFPW